jgi:choline dehydrogenase-like flavoprotein
MPGDTLNVATKAAPQNHYDAIVIGSGISGGWAAKELCEKGLKVLMVERGRDLKHIAKPPNWTSGRRPTVAYPQ